MIAPLSIRLIRKNRTNSRIRFGTRNVSRPTGGVDGGVDVLQIAAIKARARTEPAPSGSAD